MNIRVLAACAVLAASSLVYAQAHTDSFVYQGQFMDTGVPANGMYDISFIVYDSPVGGSIVFGGSQTVLNVEVVDGLFETLVNFGITGTVFDSDQVRWLNVAVRPAGGGAFQSLTPRQRITPAPLANYALRAGHAETSGTSLQDAYENGKLITLNNTQGVLEIQGAPTQDPAILIRNELAQLRAIYGQSGFDAGLLFLYGPTGNRMIELSYDISVNGGGLAEIARNDSGSPGIVLEGNRLGSQASRISIFGVDRNITLDTNASDDNSVFLPTNAINATEILNEPGVSESVNSGSIALTPNSGTIDTVASVSVNAPTSGFVLVIGSAELTINHTNGTTSSVDIGVSSIPTSIPGNSDLETRISTNAPTGDYDHVITTHAVFSANAGLNTYYLLGNLRTPSASASVLDTQLSAIFIPTAYGTASREAGPNIPDEYTPLNAPLHANDISQEREEALRADLARQQRELDAMKAQMQHLLEDLHREEATQQKRD